MFYGSQKDQSFYFHVGTKQHRDKYKRSEFARSLFFQYKKKKKTTTPFFRGNVTKLLNWSRQRL